ncbi:hypothetical protein CEXT_156041 [Caerostris extrusa]|uniref:Uncharacterized protein n=1 Tax=Caerostris extrusa TaxID=172846 RepID=A0AAV4QCM1_CAEEX|nr:hypothetical protein CEXT_156041 [Caerostris extrusa]
MGKAFIFGQKRGGRNFLLEASVSGELNTLSAERSRKGEIVLLRHEMCREGGPKGCFLFNFNMCLASSSQSEMKSSKSAFLIQSLTR